MAKDVGRITKMDDLRHELGEKAKNLTASGKRPRKARFANYLSDAAGNEVNTGDKVMAVVNGSLYPAEVTLISVDGQRFFVDVEVETSSFPYPEKKEDHCFEAKFSEYRGSRCMEILRTWE